MLLSPSSRQPWTAPEGKGAGGEGAAALLPSPLSHLPLGKKLMVIKCPLALYHAKV